MTDKIPEDLKQTFYCDSYPDDSQASVADAALVPLDASEDAQFSDQMFTNIQERLTRINNRVQMATTAIGQLRKALRAKVARIAGEEPADKMAGGDMS